MARTAFQKRSEATSDNAGGCSAGGLGSGMDRDTLNRSLKAVADELAALGREQFKANFARGVALQKLDEMDEQGDVHPDAVQKYNQNLIAARAKAQTLTSIRTRLDTIGQALQTDAAALTAERAAYAHALTAVASIQANIAPPASAPALISSQAWQGSKRYS